MNNLLNTHALIWFINGDSQLSIEAKQQIERRSSFNFISIASIWEVAIKVSLGKLKINTPFSEVINQIRINSFHILSISFEHTLRLSELPFHHRDPFDRMLACQAINNQLRVISKDNIFKEYNVPVIWE